MDVPNSTNDKGANLKGTAQADHGQYDIMLLPAGPTNSIVFGADNMKAIYMRKKVAGKFEYEFTAPGNVAERKGAGWEVVASSGFRVRRIGDPASTTSASKQIHVKFTASVSYAWAQPATAYNKVGAAARTALGQLDGMPTNTNELALRASAFIFKETYATYPAGTYLPISALRASFQYAAATELSSGIYTSYADGSK